MPKTSGWSMRAATPRTEAGGAQRLGEPLRFAYGPSEIEKLDVYKTKNRGRAGSISTSTAAPGGTGVRPSFAFLSEMIGGRQRWSSVILDLRQIDEAGGNLMTMVKQVRSAVASGLPERGQIRR